ncbi:MAG: hypothetical protein GY820_45440 [Gammaproteobacteria bacterium]|nr:hypothetical protein [Gammaproteobacteria bacterium]
MPDRGEPFVGKLCEKKALKLLKMHFCMKRKKKHEKQSLLLIYFYLIPWGIFFPITVTSVNTSSVHRAAPSPLRAYAGAPGLLL